MTKSDINKLHKQFTCLSLTRNDIANTAPEELRFSKELAMMLTNDSMQNIADEIGSIVIPEFWEYLYTTICNELEDMGFKKVTLFVHEVWIQGEYTDTDLDTIYEELENGEERRGKTSSGGLWYHGHSED